MGDDGQGNRADRSDCAALSFTASDLSIVIETGIDIAAFNNHGSSLPRFHLQSSTALRRVMEVIEGRVPS